MAFIDWLGLLVVLVANGIELFSRTIPVLLVVNFLLSAWAVSDLCVAALILPYYRQNDPFDLPSLRLAATGIGLLVLYAFLLFFALGSCVVVWYHSIVLCFFPDLASPRGANAGVKRTMQDYSGFGSWYRARHDPSKTRRLDRTYRRSDLSLPLMDHFCPWLWVPVSLKTIKAYLLLLVYIPVHQSFVLAVLSWSVARGLSPRPVYTLALLAFFYPLLVFWLYNTPIFRKWHMLAVHNWTGAERRHFFADNNHAHRWPMVVSWGHGIEHVTVDFNPWDLGTRMDNCRAALGDSVWQWPLFWVQPRRVREYGMSPDSDFPMGPKWTAWLEQRAAISSEGTASGIRRPPAAAHGHIRNRAAYSSDY